MKMIKTFVLAFRLLLWNKILCRIPFASIRLIFLRHYITLAHGANVLTNVELLYSGLSKSQIRLGRNSVVNSYCMLDGRHQPIVIGDNVDIGRETAIFTLEHDPNSDTHAVRSLPVYIEDHAWIAARVTILPGVRIGRGAVVGACSVVTKDVEPMSIVAGNPAKVIGQRRSALKYETRFFPLLR